MFIFETKDRQGRAVRLTKRNFENHVKTHPEIRDYIEEAKQTLEDPDVEFEADNGTTYYYKIGLTRGKFKGCYVLVIVRYSDIPGLEQAEGRVATFYPTTKISSDGELTWMRPDLLMLKR